ncbi:DapH/DapD/GlmU-related protein [Corynebacterium sp. P7003]|uniref:DapH/DapD/GlmU-related protein n=1 Tax=Corynebacterium pygosceleis TaxID=2800406 RepID=A0ABT3WTF5_9CORY|nr:DapH/DapD/GlmU-related protein [Corynebacterium pygosceleis]MCX7444470.1 DapH/DapD/GlmU-related protein [Corynebacterium pygosceleis]
MITSGASAVGIANIAMDGTVLDTWYPQPELLPEPAGRDSGAVTVRLGAAKLSRKLLSLVKLDEDRMVEQVAVHTTIPDLSVPPVDAHDVYLRLHLLSHRMARPHDINLEGLEPLLATVVWTNKGPCLPKNFEFVRTSLRSRGLIHVYAIDVLPRMVDYVVPTGVRIAEAERVRLGAHLAEGTQVLREGFVSYNSGSVGPAHIEGLMSAGTVIGAGTHIGLSATVLTDDASGTDIPHPVRVGDNCRIGVGAGVIGIDLGDDCVIGNNVVIDRTTTLRFPDGGDTAPAAQLSGQSGWRIDREPGSAEPVARRC